MFRSSSIFINGYIEGPQPTNKTDKLANISVVSSYQSTMSEVRDQSYLKKINAFRDLMKAQNDKANKFKLS
jgi:hypothetical protein